MPTETPKGPQQLEADETMKITNARIGHSPPVNASHPLYEVQESLNGTADSANLLEQITLVVQDCSGQSYTAAIWPYVMSPICLGASVSWRGGKSTHNMSVGVEEGESNWMQRLRLVSVVAGMNHETNPLEARRAQWEKVTLTMPDQYGDPDDFVRIEMSAKTGLASIRMLLPSERPIVISMPAAALGWGVGQALSAIGIQLLHGLSWRARRKAWFQIDGAARESKGSATEPHDSPETGTNISIDASTQDVSDDYDKNGHAIRLETASEPTHPPLHCINRPCIDTASAAHYLNRRPQTLRLWACFESGPLRPIRVSGRLAWPVAKIRELLGDISPNAAPGGVRSKGSL